MENLTAIATSLLETYTGPSNNLTNVENKTLLKNLVQRPVIPEHIALFKTVVQNYVTLAVLILGFVGNVWAMVLMKRPKIRVTVISLYLFTLAVSDTGFLLTMLLRQSHRYFQTGVDLNLVHRASCTLLKYTQEFFLAFSSWIITAISIERTLVVKFPLKATTFSIKKKAKITLLVMALIIAALFSYSLIMSDVAVLNGRKLCFVQEMYTYFEVYVRFSLTGTFTSYIPIAVITVCTAVLVHSVAKAKIHRQKLRTSSSMANNSMNRCTVTAVVICVCFWIFSSVAMIMLLMIRINGWHSRPTATTYVMQPLISLTITTRGSINFLLYIISSSSFRKEVCSCRRFASQSKQEPSISITGALQTKMSRIPEDTVKYLD